MGLCLAPADLCADPADWHLLRAGCPYFPTILSTRPLFCWGALSRDELGISWRDRGGLRPCGAVRLYFNIFCTPACHGSGDALKRLRWSLR
jgi:hypothetical protein